MVKYLIVFLIIFISVSCKQSNATGNHLITDPIGHYTHILQSRGAFAQDAPLYYQALLKKWQNSADWREESPIDNIVQEAYMCSSEIFDVVSKAVREHYIKHGINLRSNDQIHIEYVALGKQKEHWVVRSQERPIRWGGGGIINLWRGDYDLWFLVSRINKNILVMKEYRLGKYDVHYRRLLQRALELGNFEQQRPNYNKKHIDSTTAITIACSAAAKYHGFEVSPTTRARLAGIYEEHWVAYCSPPAPVEEHPSFGFWCFLEALGDFYRRTSCPPIFSVLISREGGQVLAIRVLGEQRVVADD
ncbi:MAG: hypothetical protein LBU83_00725 [Bacteroidales bacterium]|nr:hypothetical protein [Bacteroidales bacterium]